jgi:hypothetical protein
MTTRLYESGGSKPTSLGKGVFETCVIKAGWGSSGYYSPDVLKEYGSSTFCAGRPSFANHPTEAEFENGRDITKIMGRLVSDASFRENEDGTSGLYAKIKVNPDWVDFVEDYKDTIGLSIFAAGETKRGEADGVKGDLIESFDASFPYTSVDFVVAAGAGGKVEQMMESFRLREALVSDRRQQLYDLVRDAYSETGVYAWVRDFDDASNVVYFDVDGNNETGIYKQSYSVSEDRVSGFTGAREEVHVVTSYVPVNVRQTAESTPVDINKENGMTPEEIKTAIVEAVKEALAPVVPSCDETAGLSAVDIAEAVVASGLPESARKRIYKAVEEGADVNAAIEAEKALRDEYVAEAAANADSTDGRVHESAGTNEPMIIGAWN